MNLKSPAVYRVKYHSGVHARKTGACENYFPAATTGYIDDVLIAVVFVGFFL